MAPTKSNGQWGLAAKIGGIVVGVITLIMGWVYFVNTKVDKAEYRPAMQAVEEGKLDRGEWKTWREQDAQIQQMQIQRLEALAEEHKEFQRRDE